MSGFMKCIMVLMVFILVGSVSTSFAFAAANPAAKALDDSQIDDDELLEATPVDEDVLPIEPLSEEQESDTLTSDTLPPGEPYPIGKPQPVVTPFVKPQEQGQVNLSKSKGVVSHGYQFLPYSFSAYIPELDATEVDLGLLLNEPPGIEAGLNWGAMEQVMMNAKLTVQGASYTSGVNLRYAFRGEEIAETRPAIAMNVGWRFMNHRMNNDERLNIFRGNRFKTGVIFSKWLGSMARALDAKPAIEDFLNYFSIHVEALMEYQTGRKNIAEDEYSGIEFGARAAVEIEIDPNLLYLSLIYDSLPDWLGVENYFVGVRYYAREEFAVDIIGGRISNDYGVNISLAWMF